MKTIMFFGLFLFCMASAFADEKLEYKCYVDSSRGEQIVFYRWPVNKFKLYMAKLVSSTNVDSKGIKFYIKDVKECVPFGETFTLGKAQKLDVLTVY